MSKYIFVIGLVYSGTGKGVSAASIGMLLKARGHKVNLLKFDGYLGTASTLSPLEHGQSTVTNDGCEFDLDASHYESICGIEANKNTIVTSGSLYKELLEENENGVYLGQTIQLHHLVEKVKKTIYKAGENNDVTIVEIGGICSDIESYPFLEAIRQIQCKDRQNVLVTVVAPIIWVSTIKEFKTKPLQNGIRELLKCGIQPDILLCRINKPVPDQILDKIANLTNINRANILRAPDVESVYQVPLEFYDQNLDDLIVDMLRLSRSSCRISKYKEVVDKLINNGFPEINIGIIYKYDNVNEAYLSVKDSLVHAGLANDVKVKIHWIKAEELEQYKDGRGLHKFFDNLQGVIVPGGFGGRGVEGKIKAIQYVREKKIAFLGICLGLQCAVIEFARNVCKLDGANSTEFDEHTNYPVVDFVEGQKGLVKKSGTLRLGAYDCELLKDSLIYDLYGKKLISERHRHRYEVNPAYIEQYEKKGLIVSGRNPETGLVEMMELDRSIHGYFVMTQSHPEFRSRLLIPAPLFVGLVAAAKEILNKEEK